MAVNMREIIGNKISAVLVLDTLEPYKGLFCFYYSIYFKIPAIKFISIESDDPFLREIPTDQRAACFRAIAELVGDEFIPHPVESAPHIIEAGAGRFVLRKLLQTDPRQTGVKLSDFIAELPSEQLGSFTAINPGCFALLGLY
jgi:hypothetical protein